MGYTLEMTARNEPYKSDFIITVIHRQKTPSFTVKQFTLFNRHYRGYKIYIFYTPMTVVKKSTVIYEDFF